ncbi:MAG: helix-turn-helix domain-containing protein [Bacteroidales bacterium]|nr:helix-turn-helix domain-containing protein [Bacteroidales bacterium]
MKRLGFWTIVFLLALASCSGEMPGQAGHDVIGQAGHDASRHPRLDRGSQDECAFREVAVERLADLNIPRSGHVLVDLDGELTVIGGHTTGFVLTETAEYYKNGKWHQLGTLYPHDAGTWVKFPSGEVIIAGGCEQSFGRGQSGGVECYDPSTHTFAPLPILDMRRTRFSIARLSDGTLLMSGNWYKEDAIALWSPETGGYPVKDVSQERTNPFVLPVSSDNAFIFGGDGNYAIPIDSIIVDQVKGDPFQVSLLDEWRPVAGEVCEMSRYFIGDESIYGYAWLFHVRHKEDGRSGIMKLVGEEFSLLDTESPIPMSGLDGEPIMWGGLLTDKAAEASYLVSWSDAPFQRLYFCKVEYGEALRGGKARLTLYCAQMPEPRGYTSFALLSGGRFAVVGGIESDNYHPIAGAFILHTEPSRRKSIIWLVFALCLLAAAVAVVAWRIRHTRKKALPNLVPDESEPTAGPDDRLVRLMEQITVQMEEKELFRRSGLTKEDLARAVSSNSRYVSDCINAVAGCSFIDYVNGYRIRYAQRLLYENPDMRLSEISEESGFSSEVTFYRNFKARTGQTPGEWLAAQNRS